MANVLQSVMTHYEAMAGKPVKAVVWAHNVLSQLHVVINECQSHLGDARYTQLGQKRGEHNLGQLCREKFGQDCFLIGQLTHSGTVSCASDWDGHMETKFVNPSIENSWENLMRQASKNLDSPVTTVKLRYSEVREVLKMRELYERYIGVIYRPDSELISHYSKTFMPLEYDYVIYHEGTSAVGLLET